MKCVSQSDTTYPAGLEKVSVVGKGEGNLLGFLLDPIPLPPVETFWTERQYVYGPGYVDEFVREFSPSATAGQADDVLYFLQDANYNVVALTDATGAIAEQRVFEPYGELAAGETFCEHAVSRVGHQGLFFERLDGTVNQPPIAPGALGFYYNRNRMYSPTLGRFLQRDPNQTALPIITALSSNGQAMDILLGGFSPNGLFGDGMNLYLYQRGNPISGLDPSGLDDFDDAMDALGGQAIAAIGMLNEGARWASLSLGFALDVVGAVTGLDVLDSVFVIARGGGGFWEALDIFMTVNPIGRIAKIGAVMGMASNFARRGRGAAKLVGTIFEHLGKRGSYRQLAKLTKGKKGAIEAHRILEWRHIKRWKKSVKKGDLPAVILTNEQHKQVTQALRRALPYGRRHKQHEVWQAYQRVYRQLGHSEWLEDIVPYFP